MTFMTQLQNSAFGKVLFMSLLALALLIPLGMIEGLIRERAGRQAEAQAEIARSWGGAQTVGGPILVVPYRYTRMQYGQTVAVNDELYALPAELAITGNVAVEERRRGIYRIPVYTARLSLSGRLGTVVPPNGLQDLEVLWDAATVALPIGDGRAIRAPVALERNGTAIDFAPGGIRAPGFGEQLIAPLAALGPDSPQASRAFSIDLTLGGSGSLDILPLGDTTRVDLASNWPSPSFGGAFLPAERSVGEQGFTAQWSLLSLGRGYASRWSRSDPEPVLARSQFGVVLLDPVGVHTATLRAVKYAVLFIGLTFAAYFLFELFAPLRLHALQYLLIGTANCVFYVLLIALAEHIGFGPAYSASALAATALTAGYSAAVLGSVRRAAPIAALLASLYGYLYVTLQAEDYALLFGALGLFGVLAAFMYMTRRVDWYAVSFDVRRGTGAPSPTTPPTQLYA